MRDLYEMLQVSKNAEIEVIEAAYRRLARKYHPDTNPSPDAKAKMQEINAAYEVLRDPLRRRYYDSTRVSSRPSTSQTSARGSATPARSEPSPPKPAPRSTAPSPPPAKQSASSAATRERSFLEKYWPIIAVAVGAYYLISTSQDEGSGPDASTSGANEPRSLRANLQNDQYADCIDWTITHLYDAQSKCVLGRIISVRYEYDDPSGADVWTGYFSANPDNGFRVISVDRDISQWEGQCVVVHGTLFDRDLIRAYDEDPQPSMVDSDPYDDRGFSISSAPAEKCN